MNMSIVYALSILGLFAVAANPELLAQGRKRQEPRRSAECEGGLSYGVISRDNRLLDPVSASLHVSRADGMEVHATARVKIPLVCMADSTHDAMRAVATRLQTALGFSGQFTVTIKDAPAQLSKKMIRDLYTQGYPLAIVITRLDHHLVEWRLYDTMKATMIVGKKCEKDPSDTNNWWALHIAHSVWPELTGQEGFFMTKIAYSKQIMNKKGRLCRHIYVADFDGKNEELVVSTPTINIMPRWNYDHHNPLLFYSEYTNDNVRMMMVDTRKRRKIASNFEGINMLTSFSADGKKVVYCASRGDGNCQMYYHENGVFKRLLYTDHATGKSLADGNNISPTMSHDGTVVYFCSDFQTSLPQLYAYDIGSSTVTRITDGGYCASPAYCHKTQQLAYTKKVDGIMQVCIFNAKTGVHQQITYDDYTKDECSWSPCGNYLLVSIEKNNRSSIAVYSMLTKQLQAVTGESDLCAYPSWSPVYPHYTLATDVGRPAGSRVA